MKAIILITIFISSLFSKEIINNDIIKGDILNVINIKKDLKDNSYYLVNADKSFRFKNNNIKLDLCIMPTDFEIKKKKLPYIEDITILCTTKNKSNLAIRLKEAIILFNQKIYSRNLLINAHLINYNEILKTYQ